MTGFLSYASLNIIHQFKYRYDITVMNLIFTLIEYMNYLNFKHMNYFYFLIIYFINKIFKIHKMGQPYAAGRLVD